MIFKTSLQKDEKITSAKLYRWHSYRENDKSTNNIFMVLLELSNNEEISSKYLYQILINKAFN